MRLPTWQFWLMFNRVIVILTSTSSSSSAQPSFMFTVLETLQLRLLLGLTLKQDWIQKTSFQVLTLLEYVKPRQVCVCMRTTYHSNPCIQERVHPRFTHWALCKSWILEFLDEPKGYTCMYAFLYISRATLSPKTKKNTE